MKYSIIILLIFVSQAALSQSVIGKWKTIDDETGKPKSVVEIYEKDGEIFGKIVELINPKNPDPICDKCSGDRKNKKIMGMEIVRNMVLDDDEYNDGTICDPGSGKIYDCKLWLNEDDANQLMVRGYVAFFYRTQTWHRVTD